MSNRGSSTNNTLLVAIILILTFPFWIGAIGIVFGIIGGVFGAIFGVFGAVFGALATVITLPFKILFGWHDWHWWPHFHMSGFTIFLLIVLVALIVRKRQNKSESSKRNP